MKNILNKKIFHICIIIIIMIALFFAVGISMLKYEVEGETNLPFEIRKIAIISSVGGKDKGENAQGKWHLAVNQNNDIYVYIEKNSKYKKTEIIENIKLENFVIKRNSEKGENSIYKPQEEQIDIFNNIETNKVNEIEYIGDLETNIKNLKISNQGGIIVFRVANDNISEYISDSEEEINHNELLKKTEVNIEDLRIEITFDITVKLNSGKVYKAEVNLQFPTENIVEEGIGSQEITELENIVFKRIENSN